MRLAHLLRQFRQRFDQPANHLLRIELDSAALAYNINQFKTHWSQHELAAVLKSNAYGHGLVEVGGLLDKNQQINYLVVDNIIEAQLLRQAGIKKPLIILGYIPERILASLSKIKNCILVINSLAQAKILQATIAFPLTVHVKVDSGMHRQGMPVAELQTAIELLCKNPKLKIEGLASHLADADSLEEQPTLKQLTEWQGAVKIFRQYNHNGKLHFAATAGIRYADKANSNLIRVGIGLYGLGSPKLSNGGVLDLKPVLSYFAKIVNIKNVKAGKGIGYNFTFKADHDMTIAVLPCGYYEGVPRALSNQGCTYWKNTPLPIVGRVSMNLITVDVTPISKQLKPEDEIEVFSAEPQKLNSIQKVAELCNTIPYDIVVHFPQIIKRYVI